jgi:NADPH:quinone reductase-like Zn-dependent oxidoreductase
VHATSVNPFDCAARAGYVTSYFNYTLPLILGTDVSGVIEEVGSGVTNFSPGDAVYTRAGVYRDGTYADYVLASAAEVALKPQSLDHIQSAALPHVTLTAWQALYVLADLQPGQTVLIHGAAGGVGHIAVQLAKLRGDELCVDQIIDYTTTPFENLVHDVDVVLDTIGGDTLQRSWSTLKPGGILVSTVEQPSEEIAAAHGVRQAMVVSAPPIAETLAEVARMVDAGQIKPVVSNVLSLPEIQTAHQIIEGKHARGKIVLKDGID